MNYNGILYIYVICNVYCNIEMGERGFDVVVRPTVPTLWSTIVYLTGL